MPVIQYVKIKLSAIPTNLMETTILTFEQMKERYPDEWLLIGFTALDEHLNVITGEVIAHSKERDEIYAALDRCQDRSFAIEHTGSPDPNISYLL
jgi:hypothetical protein